VPPKLTARVLLCRLVGDASLSFSTVQTQGTGVIPLAQLVLQASISLFDVRLNRSVFAGDVAAHSV
jgi:hypothetical protein